MAVAVTGAAFATATLPDEFSLGIVTVFLVSTLVVTGVELVVHELAHYAVGTLIGMRVDGLFIGTGPALLTRIGPRQTVCVRLILTQGFVPAGVKQDQRLGRVQALAFQLGPAVLDLLVMAAAILYQPGSGLAAAVRAGVIAGAAVHIASVFTSQGDGRRALGELRRQPAELPIGTDTADYSRLISLAHLPLKTRLDELRRRTNQSPGDPAVTCALAIAELADDNNHDAIALLQRLVPSDGLNDLDRSALASILALSLMARASDVDAQASTLAEIAYSLTPWEMLARAAKGIALVDAHNFTNGLALIDSVIPRTLKPDWQARLHCAAAQAHRDQGNAKAAARALRSARKADKDSVWIDLAAAGSDSSNRATRWT